MADSKVPKGPGQPEVVGGLSNPQAPADTGWYEDPESGAVQHVTHPAAADALVRMGWEHLNSGPDPNTDPKAGKEFVAQRQARRNKRLNAIAELESEDQDEDLDDNSTETQEGEDSYKVTTLENGNKRYFKNGKQISAAQYKEEVEDASDDSNESEESDETA